MSDRPEGAPRRALPPEDAGAAASPGSPSGHDDGPRRGLWTPASDSPDATVRRGSLPIPPPSVRPDSSAPAASSGRRFSAADLPDEATRPLPRRSATSPTGPEAPVPSSAPTPMRRTPAPRDGRDHDTPSPESADEAAGRTPRRTWLIAGVALLLVVALAVSAALLRPWESWQSAPAPSPTPTIDPVATWLAQPGDLAGLREGATWDVHTTDTEVGAETPQPKCLLTAPEAEHTPENSLVRTFAPTEGGPAAGVLHQVDTYADDAQATAAFAERAAQLGACERTTAWAQGGHEITGLADQATGVTLLLQDLEPEHHTILVTRTGRHLNIIDATQPDAAPGASAVAGVLTPVGQRQCADGGTCPSQVAVADSVPPPAEPPGWLASVDLPRITAGSGRWNGIEPPASATLAGTRCEAVDLTAPSGATRTQHRTYILQDDTSAPATFGLDEVIWTMPSAEAANTLVGTLTSNIDACATRTATAQVSKTAQIADPGTGASWVVTQRVDQSETTQRYRSAAVAVGDRVVYLLVNPTNEFDFSDDAWHGVARRAVARTTQLP